MQKKVEIKKNSKANKSDNLKNLKVEKPESLRCFFDKNGRKKVLFILGPTAVGKSDVAVKLAKEFDGEIISADSVQIFKGLDIGSAKITKAEMQGIKHYGIDICEPEDSFSAFEFAEFTRKKIDEIVLKGKFPIIVGGTGLYIRAIVEGFNFGETNRDDKLRKELENILQKDGVEALFEILKKETPEIAEKIDKSNPVRIIRSIEIARSKGKKDKAETQICPLVLALVRPREQLYADINLRVEQMLKNGLIEEVAKLKERGLSAKNQCMHAIGYKEVLAYLDGEIDKTRMIELVKQHSRNYAKRQLTFLRGMNCEIVDMTEKEEGFNQIRNRVKEFVQN